MSIDILAWLGLKGKPKAIRKPAGYTKTTGPHGEYADCDTLQCVHCGAHWEVVVGSGRERGFCTKCFGPTCGGLLCMVCVPFEQRLENVEQGRVLLAERPVSVPVEKKLIVPPSFE